MQTIYKTIICLSEKKEENEERQVMSKLIWK